MLSGVRHPGERQRVAERHRAAKPVAGAPGRRRLPAPRTFQQELVVDELVGARQYPIDLADHISESRQAAQEEIDRAMDFVEVTPRASVPGRQLQPLRTAPMIEIGKTLVGKPKAILLDEPVRRPQRIRDRAAARASVVQIPEKFGAQAHPDRSRRRSDRVGVHRNHGARFRQIAGVRADPRGARRSRGAARLSGDGIDMTTADDRIVVSSR